VAWIDNEIGVRRERHDRETRFADSQIDRLCSDKYACLAVRTQGFQGIE
jgi:hypothetical protein